MDTWYPQKPMNGKFPGRPHASAEKYVAYFKNMAEAKIPVTINLAMTADVTDEHPIFNPECVAIMEEVRKAIRGK
jgi:hypothetical protein